jgi:hypothetical protein
MPPRNQVIGATAGNVADERVTITIETAAELVPGRRESRARVVAAGLSDDDIDRLVKQVQHDVEPRPE